MGPTKVQSYRRETVEAHCLGSYFIRSTVSILLIVLSLGMKRWTGKLLSKLARNSQLREKTTRIRPPTEVEESCCQRSNRENAKRT